MNAYRGRIAPSPTGYLHLGHARTFWTAQQRARGGTLILRDEDLDRDRARPQFAEAMIEDLRWLGLDWQEGPDIGGSYGPYRQSERGDIYRDAWVKLKSGGWLYPCRCSRKDLAQVMQAPHDDEGIYPGTCRGLKDEEGANWRFRVPDGDIIAFQDGNFGNQQLIAGEDFGDFLIWRRDGLPSYQLAVVVDDAAMRITEVVRGADLLKSTARQILLARALGLESPAWYHCDLLTDADGRRLAKRHDALSLRALRAQGNRPEDIVSGHDFSAVRGASKDFGR